MSSPLHGARTRRNILNTMADNMDLDSPDQHGTKRAVEEPEVSELPKPKRIKVRAALAIQWNTT